MELFLIDGIGPFFRHYRKRQINWSKIPFTAIPQDKVERSRFFAGVRQELVTFSSKAQEAGFNGITFDDVAHLTPDPRLEPEIQQEVYLYGEEYRQIFALCKRYELDVYITMDVLSLTPALKKHIHGCTRTARHFLREQVGTFFRLFPEVKGLILRIGECDGKDVKGPFRSELLLRTPRQVNRLIHDLLPIFASFDKRLILRSWTVGAYRVGDLIWHRRTMARVLRGVDSPHFILSMKYGETDFFRFLPLNDHFFRIKQQKIIELQARREYEGCGEYPSFIGWDYYHYAKKLESAENMVGVSIWCQTGGWLPFRRLTFLDRDALWNEMNTIVSLKIFKDKMSVVEAVEWYGQVIGCRDNASLLHFLKLNDEVIKELLYIEELACQKLFFRRIRIPPLLSVFWHNIFINHSVRKILLALVECGDHCVNRGYEALKKIEQMKNLAKKLDLLPADIEYMEDTFAILALAREYYFFPYDVEVKKKITKAKKKYKRKYPKTRRPRYRIKTSFVPFSLRQRHIRWLIRLSLRNRRGYRVLDYLLTLHILAAAYRLLTFFSPKLMPKFARKKAMGIDTIFK